MSTGAVPDPMSGPKDAIYQWVLTGSGLAPDQVIWADNELVLTRVGAAVRLSSVAKALRLGAVGVGEFGKVRVIEGCAVVEVPLHLESDVSKPSKES